MMRSLMNTLDNVVLRAVVSGLWLVLVSFQFLEGSDPLHDGDGITTLTRIACGVSASAGVAWLAVAARIVAARGIAATTWRRSEHLFAVGSALALLGAAALTASPVHAIMGVALIVTSILDLIDADRARALVAEHGLVEAAAQYERLAGSREKATSNALGLLSVRDEVGTELAGEVLFGIPLHAEPES